jgi:peptide/nickel transport system substrate-binding protein
MRHLRRAAIALASFTLVACTGTDGGQTGGAGGTVIANVLGDAQTLFPLTVFDETGRVATDLIFDRLAEIGDDLATFGDKGFAPRLAKRWEWSGDSLSIAFHIDPNARWHDGRSVRAEDVVVTHRLAADSALASPLRTLIGNIDSVSVRDSLTAVVWYRKRAPEQFYDFVYQLPIVPAHVYGGVPAGSLATSEILRKPVGSGRFRLATWEPDVRIELLADTANYRGRPKLDRVVLSIGRDPGAAATQLATSQTDFFQAYPFDRAAELDSSTVARPQLYRTLGYVFMAFNLHPRKSTTGSHPILGDIAVRRALSMAVDRQGLLTNVFGNQGVIGHGPFPSTLAAADTTLSIPPYNIEGAKALLDSAGWKEPSPGAVRQKNGRPLKFELTVLGPSATRSKYAVLIQEQLRRVGAQVDLSPHPFQPFIARQDTHDFDAITAAFNTDPGISGTKQAWQTDPAGTHGNVAGYANPKVDALLDSALSTFDLTTAKQFARRAFQQIVDDVPAIWLYDVVYLSATNRRIDTKPFRADGWWNHLDEWEIPPAKRIDRDRIGLGPAR